MTVSVDRQGRERIDNIKNQKDDGKKYIYESPDNGKTIYRREIENHDDVSGVKLSTKDGWRPDDVDSNDPMIVYCNLQDAIKHIEYLENKVKKMTDTIDNIQKLTRQL
tara:strand:+ start:492 stop:815 length:324 start_codon:yes stop_codon:yes gene_type:complete